MTDSETRPTKTTAAEHENPPPRSRRRLLWVFAGITCLGLLVWGSYLTVRRMTASSISEACQQAMQDGDWASLESQARRWSELEPNKAAPWMYLAEVAQQRGDLTQAVSWLEKLPDSDPMTPAALLEQSNLYFGPLNQPRAGAESCERALRLDPTLQEAYRRLIYFYAYTLQRRKMVEICYRAIENDCDLPETYVYLFMQDSLSFANGYDENTKWLQGSPDEEMFLIGQAVYGIKSRALPQADEAGAEVSQDADPVSGAEVVVPYHRTVVDSLFQRFPDNIELLVYYLQTSSNDGDMDRVAEILSSAPSAAAEDNRFWRFKGWLHAARGELTDAVESFRKALELNPYDSVAPHQWAAVERRLNHTVHVETLEELARDGQQLRRELVLMPNLAMIPPEMLRRLARHAAKCGDQLAADKLSERVPGKGAQGLGLMMDN